MIQAASNFKDYFYVFGIIATFALGLWNITKNYRLSKKTTFINTVTSERIKWMEKLRNNISEFCGLTYNWCIAEPEDQISKHEHIEKIDKLRYVIRLQLNPRDGHDQIIEKLIFEIPTFTHRSQEIELKQKINELIVQSQSLLKLEWERVKDESRRGDLKENENAFDIIFAKLNDLVVEKVIKKIKWLTAK
jgi:hypothetical protein